MNISVAAFFFFLPSSLTLIFKFILRENSSAQIVYFRSCDDEWITEWPTLENTTSSSPTAHPPPIFLH